MTSQRVSDLMVAFRSVPVRGESPEKIEIVRQLEDIDEPEATHFLSAIAADAAEYDLARIEAIKILELRSFAEVDDRAAVGRALLRVLEDDEDDQVRAYAARALANFTAIPGVLASVGALVQDHDEDEDVRHNAFFAIERSSPTEEAIDLLTNLLTSDDFKEGAARVLAKWNALDT
jgi:HEAT repeat protein